MLITRIDPITQEKNILDVDVTFSEYYRWAIDGMLIQDAMPNTTVAEREFIMTGIHPETWANVFGVNK